MTYLSLQSHEMCDLEHSFGYTVIAIIIVYKVSNGGPVVRLQDLHSQGCGFDSYQADRWFHNDLNNCRPVTRSQFFDFVLWFIIMGIKPMFVRGREIGCRQRFYPLVGICYRFRIKIIWTKTTVILCKSTKRSILRTIKFQSMVSHENEMPWFWVWGRLSNVT